MKSFQPIWAELAGLECNGKPPQSGCIRRTMQMRVIMRTCLVLCVLDKICRNYFFWSKEGVLGTSFLRCSLLFLHYNMKAQNAHPETKQPGWRYRDMGGRLGNTCLVHAKSKGGVIWKIGVGFLENIRTWSFPENTSCHACNIHAKNTQERCLCKALQSYPCYLW